MLKVPVPALLLVYCFAAIHVESSSGSVSSTSSHPMCPYPPRFFSLSVGEVVLVASLCTVGGGTWLSDCCSIHAVSTGRQLLCAEGRLPVHWEMRQYSGPCPGQGWVFSLKLNLEPKKGYFSVMMPSVRNIHLRGDH